MWPFSLFDQTRISPARLLRRLLSRSSAPRRHAGRQSRVAPPPPPWGQAAGPWRQLWARLQGATPPHHPGARLAQAVAAFERTLCGLQGPGVGDLRIRVQAARSLHELWHLRPELFLHLAREHSEIEAEARLAQLNPFFPVRVTPQNPESHGVQQTTAP